ncbi:MAG: hypothetical protein ACLUOB_01460 [Subdoligranulum sp.]
MQDNCLALCDNTWVFYFLAAPGIFVGADVCAIPHDKHQKFFRSCLTDTSFSHIPGLFFCANTVDFLLGQHRTIPALRLKHRSQQCEHGICVAKHARITHIQYYLRFWLGICRTSLAVSALRIMRYCP